MERILDELHFFAVGVAGHIHDNVLDAVGVGHLVEEEAFTLPGALHVDVAVVQNGREESLHFARRVLDAEEENVAHMTDEETALFDIDDALIGNDPNVQVVVDPNEKSEEPEENEERALDKKEERAIDAAEHFGVEESERDENADNRHEPQDEGNKLHENIEPVSVDDEQNLFVGILSLEVKGSVQIFPGNHHMGALKFGEFLRQSASWRIQCSTLYVYIQ